MKRLQAIDNDNDSDAENRPAANPAAYPIHVPRPAISSNLHLSHGLDPFEVPPLEELTDKRLAECLKSAFGYGGFRGQQLEVVRRVLEGKSTLAVLPTGKSSWCDGGITSLLPVRASVHSNRQATCKLPSSILSALTARQEAYRRGRYQYAPFWLCVHYM